jgi:hypothetical protein
MPQTPKKLSRRDALKVLGAAAGATALANLPSRWTTPVINAGVLPAHAQSSCNGSSLTAEITFLTGLSGGTYVSASPDAASDPPNQEGYRLSWVCRDECILLYAYALSGEGDAQINLHVTVEPAGGASNTFDLTYDTGVANDYAIVWVYLNGSTGVYNSGEFRLSDDSQSMTVDGCPPGGFS